MCSHENGMVRRPDFRLIKETAMFVNLEARKLQHIRPDCAILKEKYDEVFNSYRRDIEKLDKKRKGVLDDLMEILKTKGYSESTGNVWQRRETLIKEWLEEKEQTETIEDQFDRRRQLNRLWRSRLTIVNTATNMVHKNFDTHQLEEAKKMKNELTELKIMLKILDEPTHEWKPIEWSTLTIRESHIREADGSLDAPFFRTFKEVKTATRFKCARCQKEKDAQNIT
jgi:hypothetical protein